MAFSMPVFYWPLTIAAANDAVSVDIGGGTLAADVADGTYNTLASLLSAVEAALVAVAPTVSWGCYVDADGVFVISADASFTWKGTASPDGNSWLNLPAGDQASVINGDTGDHEVRGVGSMGNVWAPGVVVAGDTGDTVEEVNSSVTIAVGGVAKFFAEDQHFRRTLFFDFLSQHKAWGGGDDIESAKSFWNNGRARFEYYSTSDAILNTSVAEETYVLDERLIIEDGFKPRRMATRKILWSWDVRARKFVS